MSQTIFGLFRLPANHGIAVEALCRSRIRHIIRGLDYLPLAANPKAFLHILPVGVEEFTLDKRNQQTLELARTLPLLFRRHPHYHRINLDGFFGYQKIEKDDFTITSYHQLFWDGVIEYCDASWLRSERLGDSSVEPIPLPLLEFEVVQTVTRSLSVMQQLNISPPFQVQIAFAGLRGYRAMASRHFYPENCIFDRDELFFRPVRLSNWDDKPELILRPTFDQLWNAGGYLCSPSYDENDNWKPDLR